MCDYNLHFMAIVLLALIGVYRARRWIHQFCSSRHWGWKLRGFVEYNQFNRWCYKSRNVFEKYCALAGSYVFSVFAVYNDRCMVSGPQKKSLLQVRFRRLGVCMPMPRKLMLLNAACTLCRVVRTRCYIYSAHILSLKRHSYLKKGKENFNGLLGRNYYCNCSNRFIRCLSLLIGWIHDILDLLDIASRLSRYSSWHCLQTPALAPEKILWRHIFQRSAYGNALLCISICDFS